jgi:hypothetical protein
MAVNGSIATEENDALLISLATPYKKVKNVISFEDETVGETEDSYFYKEFRWSTNNVTYSDYIELTDANLQALSLDSSNDFWIQYRYTVEELFTGESLEFVSIALEIETEEGTIKAVPQIECCDSGTGNSCENLVIDCCDDNRFNPYNLNKATNNYRQLSQMASDLFGHCVTYFKTDPKRETRDVILKEYSLYNVIEKSDLNILVPDNELPTREIQFNMFAMDLPDLFEIHIVKSEFENTFGVGERPSEFDYLWFPLTDRMYEVNSISLPDDFFHESTYYRVNLSLYKDRQNRDYSDAEEVQEELQELIDSAESLFGEEADNEKEKVRNPKQYNNVGLNSKDPLRKYLNPKLIINSERLISNYTIISKNNYNLKSLDAGELGLTYKYSKFLKNNSSILFLVEPNFDTGIYSNISISNIEYNTEGYTIFETSSNHGYSIGDYVQIKGTSSYNGLHQITEITDNTITIDEEYVNDSVTNPRLFKEEHAKLIEYNLNGTLFNIITTVNNIILEFPNKRFIFDLSDQSLQLENDKWYGLVFNINLDFNQLSAFVYNLSELAGYNPKKDAEFVKTYSKTVPLIGVTTIEDEGDWNMYGTNVSITNFRLFKNPIEEEEHNIMLSQYVVKDSNLAYIIDNAIPQIRSLTKNNPR